MTTTRKMMKATMRPMKRVRSVLATEEEGEAGASLSGSVP
jgi:hypothetical protein